MKDVILYIATTIALIWVMSDAAKPRKKPQVVRRRKTDAKIVEQAIKCLLNHKN